MNQRTTVIILPDWSNDVLLSCLLKDFISILDAFYGFLMTTESRVLGFPSQSRESQTSLWQARSARNRNGRASFRGAGGQQQRDRMCQQQIPARNGSVNSTGSGWMLQRLPQKQGVRGSDRHSCSPSETRVTEIPIRGNAETKRHELG